MRVSLLITAQGANARLCRRLHGTHSSHNRNRYMPKRLRGYGLDLQCCDFAPFRFQMKLPYDPCCGRNGDFCPPRTVSLFRRFAQVAQNRSSDPGGRRGKFPGPTLQAAPVQAPVACRKIMTWMSMRCCLVPLQPPQAEIHGVWPHRLRKYLLPCLIFSLIFAFFSPAPVFSNVAGCGKGLTRILKKHHLEPYARQDNLRKFCR